MDPGCMAMMDSGRGMKVQRRGILEKLRAEEARQEYIKIELGVAADKISARARRAEAATIAWSKWSTVKNKSSPLDAVLASASGRRVWAEHLQTKISTVATTSPRSQRSPSAEKGAGGASKESSTLNILSPKNQTTREENTPPEGLLTDSSVATMRNEGEEETINDSPLSIAKLHLALENLCRSEREGKAENLEINKRAQFCEEWPRDCPLPAFFDGALLEPAWSVVEQGLSDEDVCAEDLQPARKAARLETYRVFFSGFLESNEGQAFVFHVIQDGTLEPPEVQRFVNDLMEGAHFDEDVHGFRRIVAHGDEWMHSRLVHEEVEQRVRVEAAEPVLRVLLEESTRKISGHRGELAAIVQYVYSLAASRLQPFLRGAIARCRLPDVHWEMFSYAFLSAAVEIQRVVRGSIARRRAHGALLSLASSSLVPLQARIRGVMLRRRVAKKWANLFNRQAVEIQRVFRGHRSRGAVKRTLKEKTWAQYAHLEGWASLVVQRQARVWLARRAVHLQRVKVGLTSRVSKIAEMLASSDDSRSISTVFGQIDRDYRKYDRVIAEMQAREDEMAVTFVEKVLERRDADIGGAWNRFVGAVTEYSAGRKQRSDSRRAHPYPASGDKRAAASEIHDEKLMRLMERYEIPTHAKALPSAYLRAALPMHLKLRSDRLVSVEKVRSQRAVPKDGKQTQKRRRVNTLLPSSNDVVSARRHDGGVFMPAASLDENMSSISPATAAATITTGAGPTTSPNRFSSIEGKRSGPPSGARPTATGGYDGVGSIGCEGSDGGGASDDEDFGFVENHQTPTRQTRRHHGDGAEDVGLDSAGLRRWEGGGNVSAFGWESVWDAERKKRGLTGDAGSRFPGSLVRQDMPSGLAETVERLCAAAFLRGHVPHGLMPIGTTPEEAYQRYLELPPSLAKIRHEQLCTEASQPVASALRARGYTMLEQLLPLSKLEHLFGQAGSGASETFAAVSIASEIKPKRDVGGCGNGSGDDLFSPLSPFSRRYLATSREATISRQGSRRSRRREGPNGCESDESTRQGRSRGSGRVASRSNEQPGARGGGKSGEAKNKKRQLRISIQGLELPGKAAGMEQGNGRWDPSRYTSRPEEWIRPPPSVIKQRWDDSAKAFVPVNNYTFDGLYRRHHPLDHRCDDDHRHVDNERGIVDRAGGDHTWCFEGEQDGAMAQEEDPSRPVGPCRSSSTAADPLSSYANRVESIMREEYGVFFDGMAQSARELYQHMINDSGSWGSVDDPIGVLLRRAAFFIVEHPSPATRAELAVARERDLVAKGFGGTKNDLARPIALAGKFKPRGLEQDLARAALSREHVPMGREALREFVRQLDATRAGRPSSSYTQTPKTASTSRSYGSAPVDPCRTLLERRLEAAATLADPFKIRLEADGVLNVRVLARVPVRAWGLPPHYIEEIERMLGLLAARTCASEHFSAHRGRLKSRPLDDVDATRTPASCSGNAFANEKSNGGDGNFRCRDRRKGTVPKRQHLFEFDPRYQRSSLDPFGRPPRLDRVQACLNPRQDTEAGGQSLPKDEDDIPHGIWDRPAASENPSDNGGTGDTRNIEVVPEPVTAAPGGSLSSPPVGGTLLDGAQSDWLAEQESISQEKSIPQRKHLPPHRTPTKKSARRKGSVFSSAPTKTSPSPSSRFICRARPNCGASFATASTLKIHQRSHAEVPEYHRLRRAPQLFRDRPPASSEGAGAAAEKFRLRTTLPYSVRLELQQLHEEKMMRTRHSLLAGPGLSGTVATWAGVVSPARGPF
ncbi:unnamed protein product, partial [Ectocarpus fasciculatus]